MSKASDRASTTSVSRRDPRALLQRLSGTQHFAHAVAQLRPEALHGLIQACGLEDCTEVLALASTEQLSAVVDLDLWRAEQAGGDEQFDVDRFCAWLEALAESGIERAAETIARLDVALVVAGLATRIAVFDLAAVSDRGLDADDTDSRRGDHTVAHEFGGYRIVARQPDSSETIAAVLMAFERIDGTRFHRVMAGCRRLSNSAPEIDGLDALLGAAGQVRFDLAIDREERRERQGYISAQQARAFLTEARSVDLASDGEPANSPVVTAYLRAVIAIADAGAAAGDTASAASPAPSIDDPRAVAATLDLLLEVALPEQSRGLLTGGDDDARRVRHLVEQLQHAREHDPAAYSLRLHELALMANVLVAGCPLQERSFTAREASDAAAAICNLGLENWPSRWLAPAGAILPDDFLVNHDLTRVFQVGFSVLHRKVAMRAATRLIDALTTLRCSDRDVELGLFALRRELIRHSRSGMPWAARAAMDVIALLDPPTWAALLGLIAEFPVMLANVSAAGSGRPLLSIDPRAFEFVSDNTGLAAVARFLTQMPDALAR